MSLRSYLSPLLILFSLTFSLPAFAADPCNPAGPMVLRAFPESQGDEPAKISDDQLFALELNCPVDEASIAKGAWFEVEGIQSKVGVRLVTGVEREQAVCKLNATNASNLVLLAAKQKFPERTPVTLNWGSGIRSKSGFARTEAQSFDFYSRPPFTAFTRCEHSYADGSCDPFLPIYVVFSEGMSELRKDGGYQSTYDIRLRLKDGKTVWGEKSSFLEGEESLPAQIFKAPFPSMSEFEIEVPSNLEDNFGRTFPAGFKTPLKVRTGAIPPMVRFGSVFGVLELNGANALPVTLRNIGSNLNIRSGSADPTAPMGALKAMISKVSDASQAVKWITEVQNRYVGIEKNTTSIFAANANTPVDTFEVTKPGGEEAFEVVGIPITKPGFYVLEVESQKMGEMLRGSGQKLYVPTTTLVTDLAVHLKMGQESSLAWVTSLSSGAPVADAQVTLQDCTGQELWKGTSDTQGVAKIAIAQPRRPPSCSWKIDYISAIGVKPVQINQNVLIASAQKGEDFSFVLSSWDEGIETWRFGIPSAYGWSEARALQTVFDRMLFKRGETVSMKHVIRQKDTSGFSIPSSGNRPNEYQISHQGSGDKFPLTATWNEFGTAEAQWKIPENAKLGDYSVGFMDGNSSYPRFSTGSFSVLDYRLPLSTATVAIPAEETLTPPDLNVDLMVRYLAGGAASSIPVKLRYQLFPEEFSPSGALEGFLFGREEPIVGQSTTYDEEGSETAIRPPLFSFALKSIDGKLDANGSTRIQLTDLPQITRPAKLSLELEYRDPNGEVQTVSSSAPLLPGPTIVGIKTDQWHNTRENFGFTVAVVDGRGKGVANVPVEVSLMQREVYSNRKRLVGGTFAYENIAQDTPQGQICKGQSDKTGMLNCTGKIQIAGNYILEATAHDPSGSMSQSAVSVWVHEGDGIWFAQSNSDRMDLIPEKNSYEPGETARFQVRMPFREASVLVTVEREGVIESFVKKLSRSNPVIEIPVKGSYGPNVFVSALAVRGRIADVKPAAMFDPGKPAFRLGIAKIDVGWRDYTLKVEVKSDKEVFQVRDTAHVNLTVKRAVNGALLPPNSEVVIAVVDQGLLELKPNDSWNLLEAMMSRRPLGVDTAVSQLFVIGKRHFGLKALPFGGGGGRGMTRELFDTLLYWNPSVKLDAQGQAKISFPLNDSISSFRVAAVALGGTNLFGTGYGEFRTTKDLALFPGIPPVMRQGDQLNLEITAKNGTNAEKNVKISLAVNDTQLPDATVKLAAGAAAAVSLPYLVPAKAENLEFNAKAFEGEKEVDSIRVKGKVLPRVPVRTFEADLKQVTGKAEFEIVPPKHALDGLGGAAVILTRSLHGGIGGVVDYMRNYPFSCLEQKTSKSIAVGDDKLWNEAMEGITNYLDRNGLAKYFPTDREGSEGLTTYLLSIAADAGRTIPEGPKERMLNGLVEFVNGRINVSGFDFLSSVAEFKPEVQRQARKIAALGALSRYGRADVGLVSGYWVNLNKLSTPILVELLGLAQRVKELPERAARLKEVDALLRARLDVRGSVARFTTERDDAWWWDMVSGDVTIIRFALTLMESEDLMKGWKAQMPQIIRGLFERQKEGHWDLTNANAWGRVAIDREVKLFESKAVAGKTKATLGTTTQELAWDKEPIPVLNLPFAAPNKLSIVHEGEGAPWALVRTQAAVPLVGELKQGYSVKKEIRPIEVKEAGKWHVGDLIEVVLSGESEASRTWVVVSDPVPPGSSILGAGLNRESTLVASGQGVSGHEGAWVTFEERRFDGYYGYFQELAKGPWSTRYTMRLNASGEFGLPPTRIEAMYAPEMFGELSNEKITVLP